MRVLLIEDTPRLAEAVAEILRKSGYGADIAHIGADGLAMALTGAYDAVLLDIMLPDMSGMDVLRELREIYPNLPLIASGGRSSLSVRETVQAGANAVIWTPPSAQQLQADMMRRYREAEVKPEVPIMDPVAAADVNPLESARADVPIPDELIAKATTGGPKRQRPFPQLFFKGRRH